MPGDVQSREEGKGGRVNNYSKKVSLAWFHSREPDPKLIDTN